LLIEGRLAFNDLISIDANRTTHSLKTGGGGLVPINALVLTNHTWRKAVARDAVFGVSKGIRRVLSDREMPKSEARAGGSQLMSRLHAVENELLCFVS
jgi:hypothetical protein